VTLPEPSPARPRVVTPSGAVLGRHSDREPGVEVYAGIPYAEPPVGPLRFRAPRPARAWSGVLEAVRPGPAPPQNPGPALGSRPVPANDECCLYLDVRTPGAGDALRPVMVWIYGGGFSGGWGGDPLFAGDRLVARGDVVLVTFSYRLGVLGFGHLDAPNIGLADQIAALRWVARHIAAFGGDPENVTLFGESAGAMSAFALAACPESDGLFHRLLAQSGACTGIQSLESAAIARHQLVERLGTDDIERLRTMPVEQLLAAQDAVARHMRAAQLGNPFHPIVDGALLPRHPLEAQRLASNPGRALLIGTNRAPRLRGRVDAPLEAAHHALARYAEIYRERGISMTPVELLAAADTDLTFRLPASRVLAARHAADTAPSWSYLFAWSSPALRGRLGACHAVELPFVFGTLDAPGMARFAGSGPAAEALSARVIDLWAAFARGRPLETAFTGWAPWRPAPRSTLRLDAAPAVVEAPLEAERRVWTELWPDVAC